VSRGTTDITVTADDGAGGTVTDTFTVTVKAAPDVASPIADIGELETGTSRQISLSGVFSDPDGDTLTVSVTTSDRATADISAALDATTLSATAVTVIGVAEGTATITVTAQDTDGNQVSDTFDVTVPAAQEEPQQQQQAQQQQQEEEEEEEEPQQQAEAPPGQVVNLSVRQTQPTRIRVEWDPPHDGGAVNSYQGRAAARRRGTLDTASRRQETARRDPQTRTRRHLHHHRTSQERHRPGTRNHRTDHPHNRRGALARTEWSAPGCVGWTAGPSVLCSATSHRRVRNSIHDSPPARISGRRCSRRRWGTGCL